VTLFIYGKKVFYYITIILFCSTNEYTFWFRLMCWCTYVCTDRGWSARVVCRTVQGAHHIVSRLEGKYLLDSCVPLEVRSTRHDNVSRGEISPRNISHPLLDNHVPMQFREL